jgi:DNA-binding XRE family transcriptional regulator
MKRRRIAVATAREKIGKSPTDVYSSGVSDELINEDELCALAKRFRAAAGKSRAEAARRLGVARPTVFQAEEDPQQALLKLRKRIIEEYSDFDVTGPFYVLRRKRAPHSPSG